MSNKNKITVQENPEVSDTHTAMRTLQLWAWLFMPWHGGYFFQLEKIFNDQLLKCLQQSNTTNFFYSKVHLICVSVQMCIV